jgi:hypothetical protein
MITFKSPEQLQEFFTTAYAIYQEEQHRTPSVEEVIAWVVAFSTGATGEQMRVAARKDYQAWLATQPTVTPLALLPKPSRDEILSARGSFQGLEVKTEQYGVLRWFDPFLGSLDRLEDRQAVYAAKLAVGQKRLTLAVSYAYRSQNQAYTNIPGRDFSKDLPALHALMEEAIRAGLYIDLRMAGDGQSRDDRSYNDPQGDTYGHQWLMEHSGEIHGALADLDPWTIYGPGFDGVFSKNYEWLPEQVRAWWLLMRSLVTWKGYVSQEWGAGICDMGDGEDTYRGAGEAVDVFYLESPWPPAHTGQPKPDGAIGFVGDEIWQVSSRMLGPEYRRPSDQPPTIDPNMHESRVRFGTPRGKTYVQFDEFDTYGHVRMMPLAQIEADRAYLKSLGFSLVG